MHTQKTFHLKPNIFSIVVLIVASFGLSFFTSGVIFTSASAADPCKDPKAVDPQCAKPKGIKLTDEQAKKAGLQPKSADSIVAQTLNGVYAIVAIVATVTIVLAGIRMITADGDSSKLASARQTIIYAVVGLAIVGSAFIITGIIQGVGTK